jgi:hypothetical protein
VKIWCSSNVQTENVNDKMLSMKKLFFLSILMAFNYRICFAQTNYLTRDSVHIFWQPNLKISFSDYKCDTTKERIKDMKDYGYYASASVGIWSALDIPKKKKDRYRKFEKVYFAPAFERTSSAALKNDSVQLAIQKTIFDILELNARMARKELAQLQEKMNATGVLSIWYLCTKKKMNKINNKMVNSFFTQVIILKQDSAFQKWRKAIDVQLIETAKWTTTPEECYRLMNGKPIEKDFIMAPKLMDMCPEKDEMKK